MGSLKDKAIFSYIKHIKRWMFCPACGDKMRINRKSDTWECAKCDYKLSDKEFRDGTVFWFCDACDSFLNNQEGFDSTKDTWVCAKCGFENNITENNIVDICRDCGEKLPPDCHGSVCEKCKTIRREKMLSRIETGTKIAAGVFVVAKAACEVAKAISDSSPSSIEAVDDTLVLDSQDYPICKTCGARMTEFDGWAWYTCPECGDSVRIIDGVTTWQDEIFGRGAQSSGITCANCGESLRGGLYTAPWENGNNPDGYIKCPHCGYVNFQWEDDD